MERELGLSLTYPHMDPNQQPAEPAVAVQERAQAAAGMSADQGDPWAQSRLWREQGSPVTSPDELVIGDFYHLGFDIGIFKGRFVGNRWEGTSLDETEQGTWLKFEVAEAGPDDIGKASARLDANSLHARPSPDQPLHPVTRIPAAKHVVQEVFDSLRRAHVGWEMQRPPEQFF